MNYFVVSFWFVDCRRGGEDFGMRSFTEDCTDCQFLSLEDCVFPCMGCFSDNGLWEADGNFYQPFPLRNLSRKFLGPQNFLWDLEVSKRLFLRGELKILSLEISSAREISTSGDLRGKDYILNGERCSRFIYKVLFCEKIEKSRFSFPTQTLRNENWDFSISFAKIIYK